MFLPGFPFVMPPQQINRSGSWENNAEGWSLSGAFFAAQGRSGGLALSSTDAPSSITASYRTPNLNTPTLQIGVWHKRGTESGGGTNAGTCQISYRIWGSGSAFTTTTAQANTTSYQQLLRPITGLAVAQVYEIRITIASDYDSHLDDWSIREL